MAAFSYEITLHKRPVIRAHAHFNKDSSLKLGYPHVVIRANQMHAYFPNGAWSVVSVAHEGIHVAHWVVHRRLGGDPEKMTPFVGPADVAWERGGERVLEEAVAKISDRWLTQFFNNAAANDLDYRLTGPFRFVGKDGRIFELVSA